MNYGYARYIWLWVLGAALIAALVIGGWQAGWWFSNQNNNRAFQQQQNGTSNQVTLREQITKNFSQLTSEDVQLAQVPSNDPGLHGQIAVEEAAQAATLCEEGEEVNTSVPLPADQTAWFQANCNLGVVAPSSKYFIPGEAGA